MTIDSVSAAASAVDGRLRANGMQAGNGSAFTAADRPVADTQSLSLIPILFFFAAAREGVRADAGPERRGAVRGHASSARLGTDPHPAG